MKYRVLPEYEEQWGCDYDAELLSYEEIAYLASRWDVSISELMEQVEEVEEEKKIVINVRRTGYSTDQIESTMTVGELIDYLSQFDDDTPVYVGNDMKSYGWYTYGGINEYDLYDGERIAEEFEH